MSSKIIGKLITVSHPKFTIVQQKFSERRQKLLNEGHYTTIFGQVSGCEHPFKEKTGNSDYMIFNFFKGRVWTKKRIQNSENRKFLFGETILFFFDFWLNPLFFKWI